MKISELAEKSGCGIETVRYYEKIGLLPQARRNPENNYRCYDQEHLENLLFIRRCRSLDMTQEEIRALLLVMSDQNRLCAPIDAIIHEHLNHVQKRIEELILLEKQLSALRADCRADRRVDQCGIVKSLTQEESAISLNNNSGGGHTLSDTH
ncbi:MAG: Mercuric resistance operon regulatory protein [Candidatus Erwinia impunctatus]|nr:Mercuric resistance operon regulatory protein [Culicoides impunctatus]